MHRRSVLILVALVVMAAFPVISSASHSWGNYHWSRTASTVTLTLGDNVSGVWDTHLQTAEGDWDQSGVLTLSVGAGGTRPKSCRPQSGGRIEVCNAKYGTNGWLGLAQIWLSGGHINQAIAKMNDSYVMNEPEKLHVMCQEVGHGFGLGHTSEDGSSQNTCMDYYQNQNQNDWTSTSPNAHDYNLLDSIYSHSHAASVATSGFMAPPAMGMIDFAGQDQWGVEVWREETGRASVFFLDFSTNGGDEHGVLTHVYWASPEHAVAPEDERGDKSPWIRQ
jgi:hypothetical protein